jgi:hypothetical protein
MVGRKKGAASGFFGGCIGLLRALIASKCTRLCHCADKNTQVVDMSRAALHCRDAFVQDDVRLGVLLARRVLANAQVMC